MENKKTVIFGSIVFIIIAFFGYLVVADAGKTPAPEKTLSVATYKQTDADKPQVKVEQASIDFGNIGLKDQKEAEFTVTNIGTRPLNVWDMSTSCGCTAGKIVYNGEETKEFTMHSNATFEKEIAPGTSFKVKLIYRPWTMPVKGKVERSVFMTTNDPAMPKLTFDSTATVN